jgi:hypothetical protein
MQIIAKNKSPLVLIDVVFLVEFVYYVKLYYA